MIILLKIKNLQKSTTWKLLIQILSCEPCQRNKLSAQQTNSTASHLTQETVVGAQ